MFFNPGSVECLALLFGQAVEALLISVFLFAWRATISVAVARPNQNRRQRFVLWRSHGKTGQAHATAWDCGMSIGSTDVQLQTA
jgi:hypothetical protein